MAGRSDKRESIADKMLVGTKRVLEIGSEAAEVLVHLQHGLTPVGLTAVGVRILNSIREYRAKSHAEFFATWKPLDLGLLKSDALGALRAEATVECREIEAMHEHSPAAVTAVDGLEIGWGLSEHLRGQKARVDSVWIGIEQDPEPILARIGRSLWTRLATNKAVISIMKSEGELRLVAEGDEEIFASAEGDRLYERICKFKDRGFNRSFFIIGEPGVGKTCMLRYVASLHGGFRLRLPLADLANVDPQALVQIVRILRPDVLVIDDLDRHVMGSSRHHFSNDDEELNTPEASAMLEPLDVFDKIVPLVLVSANFSESITAALLRPGRFSEVLTLEKLDDDLYEKMLPDAPKKIIDELKRKKVPICYVEELKKRVDVLGYEAASKEMDELLQRCNRVLEINIKKARRRKNKRRTSLKDLTPGKKAAKLDQWAAAAARQAAGFDKIAERNRDRAEKLRKRAAAERKKFKKTAKKTAP